jgi:hypothetical protein
VIITFDTGLAEAISTAEIVKVAVTESNLGQSILKSLYEELTSM